jgi:hypothetical protein
MASVPSSVQPLAAGCFNSGGKERCVVGTRQDSAELGAVANNHEDPTESKLIELSNHSVKLGSAHHGDLVDKDEACISEAPTSGLLLGVR